MGDFISLMFNPIFDIGFMAQLLVIVLVLFYSVKRRSRFVLRLILFVLLAFASCYIIPYAPYEFLEFGEVPTIIWRIFGYSIHFVILVFCMFGIFEIGIRECVFICLMGFSIQHGIYALNKLIMVLIPAYANAPFLSMAAQYIPGFLVALHFGQNINKYSDFRMRQANVFYASALALVVNIVTSVIAPCDDVAANKYIVVYLIATFFGCIALTIMMNNNIASSTLLSKIKSMKNMWEKDRENYELQRESLRLFEMKTHDLKHFVRSLSGHIDEKELEKIEDILQGVGYNYLYKTGSLPLDVIANLKSNACQTLGITMNFIGDGTLLSHMEETDIYTIFCNILDNAIEAVGSVEPDKKIINLSLFKEGDEIIINAENYFSGELVSKDGTLVTTKKDSSGHGYGVQSIAYIAKKYGGYISYKTEENQFFLTVVIKA